MIRALHLVAVINLYSLIDHAQFDCIKTEVDNHEAEASHSFI